MEITTDKYNKDHSERVSEGLTDLQLHLLTCCLLTIISRHTHTHTGGNLLFGFLTYGWMACAGAGNKTHKAAIRQPHFF